MDWKVLKFSAAQAQEAEQIRHAFERVYDDNRRPEGAAVFQRRPAPDVVELFFSPAAVTIFGRVLALKDAIGTPAPSMSDVRLLTGSQVMPGR